MENIRLIGRSSRLSLLQIDIVRRKIQSAFPDAKVEVIARSSKGDGLPDIPLHTVEGSDFFTEDIFNALTAGEADIAVHSLKDMSSEHFFGQNKFAVVDRDDTRDIAVFSNYIEEKIRRGETIIIGTCSPRREEMATVFLKKALPQLSAQIKIATRSIRGNVETRLRKLNSGEYDATILATAGLNRLLKSEDDAVAVRELLADKKLMLLPLIECVPAPCQGTIVAEAHFSNAKAIEVLKRINHGALHADCYLEKKIALKYGAGCIQKFGVTTLATKNGKYLYAAGKDSEGTEFVKWDPLPEIKINGSLFSSTDVMKGFFDYNWLNEEIEIEKNVVFVSNYKAIQEPHLNPPQRGGLASTLRNKTILASGTKTWFELAKQGYWVTASADALGFEFLLSSLGMPVLNIDAKEILILTHEAAVVRWREKGYDAISNYKLLPKNDKAIQESIAAAAAVFWTSFSQYEFYGKYAKPGAKHLCAGGETAELLKQSGIEPVVFPTIKAFDQWKKYSIHSRSVA
ncbi:MAG TPA: hydroxymethylbilane synthase [Chitinophagaceae bacterium]|nr:hydroxymethylbilane synthase [Chitinophagaceae bacterium]